MAAYLLQGSGGNEDTKVQGYVRVIGTLHTLFKVNFEILKMNGGA